MVDMFDETGSVCEHSLWFVDASGDDVVNLDDHLDFLGGEGPDDGGPLLAGLLLGQHVAFLCDDRGDVSAVGGRLRELLADLEPEVGVLEGGLGGERVLSVVVRQLDDGSGGVAQLARDPADSQLLHDFLEVGAVV